MLLLTPFALMADFAPLWVLWAAFGQPRAGRCTFSLVGRFSNGGFMGKLVVGSSLPRTGLCCVHGSG